MCNVKYATLTLLLFLFANILQAQKIEYMSPLPGSDFNMRKACVVLRCDKPINPATVYDNILTVKGESSGFHKGKVILSDDGKTLVFNPETQYNPAENVSVELSNTILTTSGDAIEPVKFDFRTTSLTKPIDYYFNEKDELIIGKDDRKNNKDVILADSVPADVVPITVSTYDKPDSGSIFICNYPLAKTSYPPYLLILNDSCKVYKWKKLNAIPWDFKIQSNGQYTFTINPTAYIMDKDLNLVDFLGCQNGYVLDGHEFTLLPNGHYVVMAYDPQVVDMSKIVPRGLPNAVVTGCVIQELDKDKNLVFQWRTWDHFKLTDSYVDLTTQNVDPNHMNAVFYDLDGNLMISVRFLCEITKINRATGNIMWRLGGKNNQFTFINENEANAPLYFSCQHFIRRIKNGNITFYDNGNLKTPNYSRGVEYALDEVNKKVTLVWEYRHTPDIYSAFMGSVQRLDNGNTLINWGGGSPGLQTLLTEIKPDKSIALELKVPANNASYRAYKYHLPVCQAVASVGKSKMKAGDVISFNGTGNITGVEINFLKASSSSFTNFKLERFDCPPVNPVFDTVPAMVLPYKLTQEADMEGFSGEYHVDAAQFPAMVSPKTTFAYRTDENGIYHRIMTTYDEAKNNLVFSFDHNSSLKSFDTLIFGIPVNLAPPEKPSLFQPVNHAYLNKDANNKFKWLINGDVAQSEMRIATDKDFNNIILDTLVSNTDYLQLYPVLQKNTYYWSVRAKNAAGFSPWSDVWDFSASAPFVNVVYPNGGETLFKDSTVILRWNHNLNDQFRLELFKNGNQLGVIKDSLSSIYGGFSWNISNVIPTDSTYTLKVTSLKNGTQFDFSDANFSIKTGSTSVNEIASFQDVLTIQNPVLDFLEISFPSINHRVNPVVDADIEIYNVFGEKIPPRLTSSATPQEGNLRFDVSSLSPGVYFVRVGEKVGKFVKI